MESSGQVVQASRRHRANFLDDIFCFAVDAGFVKWNEGAYLRLPPFPSCDGKMEYERW